MHGITYIFQILMPSFWRRNGVFCFDKWHTTGFAHTAHPIKSVIGLDFPVTTVSKQVNKLKVSENDECHCAGTTEVALKSNGNWEVESLEASWENTYRWRGRDTLG